MQDKFRALRRGGLIGLFMFLLMGAPLGQIPTASAFPVEVIADTSVPAMMTAAQAQAQTQLQNATLAQHIAHYAELAQNWIKTVRFYSDSVFNYVRQFTSLKGIMDFTMKQTGVDLDNIRGMKDLVAGLRGIWQLREQFENLLEGRIVMLQNIEVRLKNGVFNPTADWADVKSYLREVGRKPDADPLSVLDDLIAESDPQYILLQEQIERLNKETALLHQELKEVKAALEREGNLSGDLRSNVTDDNGNGQQDGAERVTAATTEIASLHGREGELKKNIAENEQKLRDLIQQLSKRYQELTGLSYERRQQAWHTADVTSGWESFGEIKMTDFEKLIDDGINQPAPPKEPDAPGINPDGDGQID